VRLAIYSDYAYRRGDGRLWAELPVVMFLGRLADHFDAVTLVGRLDPRPGRWRHQVPDAVGFEPLPHYEALSHPGDLLRVTIRSVRRFWRALDHVDMVWLLGPHPLAPVFAALAGLRGRRVALGVRQDFPAYVRARHRRRRGLIAAATLLEASYRVMARRYPTVVVGPDLARRYRHAGRLLTSTVSLVSEADLAGPEVSAARSWNGELRVLSVGRLDAEKNPLLLADVLASLLSRDPRWRLIVCGEGTLEAALDERLRALGVRDRAELRGYVPVERGLAELYRSSHALLHCSWTEGVPQVLLEAFAARLPVVATAVGGVAEAAGGGALLVPPGDAEAPARELARLSSDSILRERMIEAGFARAREHTLEAEARRVAHFLAQDGRGVSGARHKRG
jgi:glycosyltransferase involved in cell wall biosynthesis